MPKEDQAKKKTRVYQRQPIPEIVKNLEGIANSRCAYQPAHVQASLWNAIEILEDLDEKERNLL